MSTAVTVLLKGKSKRLDPKTGQAWLIEDMARMLRILGTEVKLSLLLSMRTLRDFLFLSLALELTAITHGSFSLF
jgi:hypothetical protein